MEDLVYNSIQNSLQQPFVRSNSECALQRLHNRGEFEFEPNGDCKYPVESSCALDLTRNFFNYHGSTECAFSQTHFHAGQNERFYPASFRRPNNSNPETVASIIAPIPYPTNYESDIRLISRTNALCSLQKYQEDLNQLGPCENEEIDLAYEQLLAPECIYNANSARQNQSHLHQHDQLHQTYEQYSDSVNSRSQAILNNTPLETNSAELGGAASLMELYRNCKGILPVNVSVSMNMNILPNAEQTPSYGNTCRPAQVTPRSSISLLENQFYTTTRQKCLEKKCSSLLSYRRIKPTLSTKRPYYENEKIGLSQPKERRLFNICPICGRNYARPSTLRTHLRTHSGERPYLCKFPSCGKSFTQAANLTAHMRTHSGEKPFYCHVCQRRFSQSSSVTTHMRTHSGERPYVCVICRKGFADSSTLTKHYRVHSGEKPYECQLCALRFSQSGNLNRHMKVHMNTCNS